MRTSNGFAPAKKKAKYYRPTARKRGFLPESPVLREAIELGFLPGSAKYQSLEILTKMYKTKLLTGGERRRVRTFGHEEVLMHSSFIAIQTEYITIGRYYLGPFYIILDKCLKPGIVISTNMARQRQQQHPHVCAYNSKLCCGMWEHKINWYNSVGAIHLSVMLYDAILRGYDRGVAYRSIHFAACNYCTMCQTTRAQTGVRACEEKYYCKVCGKELKTYMPPPKRRKKRVGMREGPL